MNGEERELSSLLKMRAFYTCLNWWKALDIDFLLLLVFVFYFFGIRIELKTLCLPGRHYVRVSGPTIIYLHIKKATFLVLPYYQEHSYFSLTYLQNAKN